MSIYETVQPEGRFDDASGLWLVTRPWVCLTRTGFLAVRPGFESDGTSIPRFLWPFVGPRYDQQTMPAALGHDALYAGELVARVLADWTFFDRLREREISKAKAWAMTIAVRTCGGVVWHNHTPESVAKARQYVRHFSLYVAADAWANGEAA